MPVVLVVDDEPDIRALMQINLEAAGYVVVTAASGEEALELVGAPPPGGVHFDAVFLDVMVPGVDGWDVLSALKGEPRRQFRHPAHAQATATPRTAEHRRTGHRGGTTDRCEPQQCVRESAADRCEARDRRHRRAARVRPPGRTHGPSSMSAR